MIGIRDPVFAFVVFAAVIALWWVRDRGHFGRNV